MNFLQKLFKKKTLGEGGFTNGGFELLKRLTSSGWGKGKALQQYEKSLYVMACVSKIAQKVASTEFELYQIKNSKGETKEIYNHPLLDLIYKPNAFQTKTEFLKKTIINKLLAGDAYWYKVRNKQGKVVELWNLRPDFMTIIKDPELYIKGYEFAKENGQTIFFAVEDVIHFKGINPLDEFYGSSPVFSSQSRIETEQYASAYQKDFFLNSARPDAVIKTLGFLTEEQKAEVKDSFEMKHRGVGKSSKVALFEGGMDYQQISISQKEMDFIESLKFTRDDILVAFSVPKPIVAITDQVNFANAETAMYIFLSETIKPEVAELFEKINEEMTYNDFSVDIFLDFEDPTPQNREQKLLEYQNGLTYGWLLINEVRQAEGKEPIQGGWTLYKPFGMESVGGLSKDFDVNSLKVLSEKEKRHIAICKKRFRGKNNLFKKMIVADEVRKSLERISEKYTKKKEFKKKEVKDEFIRFVEGENRMKYYELINKRIDARSSNLKKEIIKANDKQGKELIALLEKNLKSKSKGISNGLKKTITNFFEEQQIIYTGIVFPFLESYAMSAGREALDMVEPGKDFIYTDAMEEILKERADKFGLSVNDTTQDQVFRIIADGIESGAGVNEISDNLLEKYDNFSLGRADIIARTEATAGSNEGSLQGFKQSVANYKEWIATVDDRTRDSHAELNGETISLDDDFSNGLMYPGDISGDPEETVNCRCVIAPVLKR